MQNTDLHNCKLVVDVGIFSSGKVLLVKYSNENKYDHQKGWFLPDDLMRNGEHPEETATRILKDQLGIENIKPEIGDIESFTGNDGSWHIVFHYKVNISDTDKLIPEKELIETGWFETESLPDAKEVAHHGWAIYTIQSLLKK